MAFARKVVSMNNKIIIISNTDGALYKFRKPLLRKLNDIGMFTIGIASPYSPEGSYSDKLNNICGCLYSVNFFRQGFRKFFRTPIDIYNICKKERPSIIHIYGHEALIFSALAMLTKSAPSFFVTVTGLGRFFSPRATPLQIVIRAMIISFYFIALNFITKIIFLNSNDLNEFSRIFPHKKNKFNLINGEGSEFSVSAMPETFRRDKPLRFLFASRLMEEKGVIDLIKAFRRLPSDYQLSVLGTIDNSLENSAEIKSMLNAEIKNIKYFGFVEDINVFLENSDCVILPSKYMEGLPIILVEALAKGKFIITSKAPGCSDTVVDGVNGFLINEVTPLSISCAVINTSNVNLEAAHKTSTRLFERKFIADMVVNKIIEAYELNGAQHS